MHTSKNWSDESSIKHAFFAVRHPISRLLFMTAESGFIPSLRSLILALEDQSQLLVQRVVAQGPSLNSCRPYENFAHLSCEDEDLEWFHITSGGY